MRSLTLGTTLANGTCTVDPLGRLTYMRTLAALAFASIAWATTTAQSDQSNLHSLPGWIYTELTGEPAP